MIDFFTTIAMRDIEVFLLMFEIENPSFEVDAVFVVKVEFDDSRLLE